MSEHEAPESQTSQSPERQSDQRELAVMAAVKEAMASSAFQSHEVLRDWGSLADHYHDAVERDKAKGERNAKVIQHADAILRNPVDRQAVNAFLTAFGAHYSSGGEQHPVTAENIGSLNGPDTPLLRNRYDQAITTSAGSLSVYGEDADHPTDLIVETKIPGVRLWFDGSAVSNPGQADERLRPMLLVQAS